MIAMISYDQLHFYRLDWMIPFVFGVLIVIVDTYNRFTDSFEIRSQTTRLQYWFVQCLYLLVYIIVYFLCANYQLLFFYTWGTDSIYGLWGSVDNLHLLSALIVVLLPKIPVLRKLDRHLRRFLKRLAGIPVKALALSYSLRNANYEVPDSFRRSIEIHFKERGIPKKCIQYRKANTPQFIWTKITSLMIQLDMWAARKKFGTFVAHNIREYNDLKSSYERLSYRAALLFQLSRELSAVSFKGEGVDTDLIEIDELYGRDPAQNNSVQRSLSEIKSYFLEQAEELENKILYYTSKAALFCCINSSRRREVLNQMGFEVSEESPTWIAYVLSMSLIFPVFGFLFLSLYSSQEFYKILLMVTMITMNYLVAVSVAIYMKTRLWFANIFFSNYRSIRTYISIAGTSVIIGFIGVISTIPVVIFFRYLFLGGDLENTLSDTLQNWPWLMLAGSAAMITAIMIDQNFIALFDYEKTNRRLKEGFLAALALGTTMLFVSFLLEISPPRVPTCIVQSIVGFIIGFNVPTWYRSRYAHCDLNGIYGSAVNWTNGHIQPITSFIKRR
jgi:hypothetical protein